MPEMSLEIARSLQVSSVDVDDSLRAQAQRSSVDGILNILGRERRGICENLFDR
jgi:hypothetical protein